MVIEEDKEELSDDIGFEAGVSMVAIDDDFDEDSKLKTLGEDETNNGFEDMADADSVAEDGDVSNDECVMEADRVAIFF